MTGRQAKRIAAALYELARENPKVVLEILNKLEQSGEVEKGDLERFRRLAEKWRQIGEANVAKGSKR